MFYLYFALIICLVQSHVEARCPRGQIECMDRSTCIPYHRLCNDEFNCFDKSDEDVDLCIELRNHRGSCSKGDEIRCGNTRYNNYGCKDINSVCSYEYSRCFENKTTETRFCDNILTQKLNITGRDKIVTKVEYIEKNCSLSDSTLLSYISKRLNEVTNQSENSSKCPTFFIPFKQTCFSAISALKTKWAEAELFCKSIGGELLVLESVEDFKLILDFFNENGLESKFWIGGKRYSGEDDFQWTNEEVEHGAPFWAIFTNYVKRSENSHEDHFLTGYKKSNKTSQQAVQDIMPKVDNGTRCIALLDKNFYYFSDEKCDDLYAPLCYAKSSLNHVAAVGKSHVMATAREVNGKSNTKRTAAKVTEKKSQVG